MSTTRTAAATAAAFLWRSTRAVLVAFAIGAVFAFGARGMADAGVSTVWLWLWGIAGFTAFTGGLAFWAVNAPKRWAPAAAAAAPPAPRVRPARPPALADVDTLTYRYAAALVLLLNTLATAMLVAAVDGVGYVGGLVPVGAVCNLAGYLVVLGALRTGQIKDN